MCISMPARVVRLEPSGALVDLDGRLRHASCLLLPDVAVGDDVLVAAGTIVERLEPREAAEIRALIADAIERTAPERSH